MHPFTVSELKQALHDVAEKNTSADFSGIKAEIEGIERSKSNRIRLGLKGVLDMALIAGARSRRFVLVYFANASTLANNRTVTCEGIEYKDAEDRRHVLVDIPHLAVSSFDTLAEMRTALDDRKIIYDMAYIDQFGN